MSCWWILRAGKTMLARRLPSILPALSEDETLEVTAIHSVSTAVRLIVLPAGVVRTARRSRYLPEQHVQQSDLRGLLLIPICLWLL